MGSYSTRAYSFGLILCIVTGAILTFCAPAAGQCDSIADPIVCQAVRDELGIDPAEPVTDADLLGLTWFRMIGDSPRVTIDVTGLQNATNLTELTLWTYEIADISVITEMPNLDTLAMVNTGTDDISPFTEMTQIDHLTVHSGGLSDLSGLENLGQLTELMLPFNEIDDISPIALLLNLEELSLRDNNLDSAASAPLQSLSKLRVLSLMSNSIDNIDFLAGFDGMEDLFLAENNISDIAPLAQMTNLEWLDLKGNPLNDAAYDVYLPLLKANNPTARIDYDPIPEPATALLLLFGAGVVKCLSPSRQKKRRRLPSVGCVLLAFALFSTPAFATVNYTWSGFLNTSWLYNSNWNPNYVPGLTDNISIDGSQVAGGWAIVEYAPLTEQTHGGLNVTIGDYSIVTHKSYTLDISALDISGVSNGGAITSGLILSAEGVSDPILDVINGIDVGLNGDGGYIVQNDGTVTAQAIRLGIGGGTGEYELNAGDLKCNTLSVGLSDSVSYGTGQGEFKQDGGRVMANGGKPDVYIGRNAHTIGTYYLNGGALSADTIVIGHDDDEDVSRYDSRLIVGVAPMGAENGITVNYTGVLQMKRDWTCGSLTVNSGIVDVRNDDQTTSYDTTLEDACSLLGDAELFTKDLTVSNYSTASVVQSNDSNCYA